MDVFKKQAEIAQIVVSFFYNCVIIKNNEMSIKTLLLMLVTLKNKKTIV